jgi:hypothetical protein
MGSVGIFGKRKRMRWVTCLRSNDGGMQQEAVAWLAVS